MSNSKLEYLQKYMQSHQETTGDYNYEPIKKKKKKKKKILQVNNTKIIEEDEILVKSSKNVENQAYETNAITNKHFIQDDDNEDSQNIDDQNINEEELPQFEDTDGNLRNLTDEQKKEIIRNGLKNQKQMEIEQKKIEENKNKSSGKWVTIEDNANKKQKRSNSSSSNSSSDSDSDSESDVRRRRLDSSDSEDREENQDEIDNILKKKLNNALGQGSDDDSDLNVKRKKRKGSDSSDSSVDSLTKLRKQQKMNQNRTTVRNEFGQVIDINDLKNQVSKEDDLKLLQEAQISRFSKGMKQMNDKKEQEKESRQILEGKFNNYDPLKEQDLHMIKQDRVGDTMGAIIKAEEEKKIQKMKGGSVILKKCPHIAPPNRFNIQPGHRWDGVDRSNGHEALIFANQNNKKRQYDEQYEQHQRDM